MFIDAPAAPDSVAARGQVGVVLKPHYRVGRGTRGRDVTRAGELG
jgi:hypothetical protein